MDYLNTKKESCSMFKMDQLELSQEAGNMNT